MASYIGFIGGVVSYIRFIGNIGALHPLLDSAKILLKFWRNLRENRHLRGAGGSAVQIECSHVTKFSSLKLCFT